MHSLSSILTIVSLALAVFAVPLGIDYTRSSGRTDPNAANKQAIDGALPEANKQIDLMKKVVDDPTNAKHKPLLEAAFGKNYDHAVVKDTVEKMQAGKVTVHPATQQYKDSSQSAHTQWEKNSAGTFDPKHIAFGQKFYDASKEGKASTMIHEASHALGKTGDALGADGKIVQGHEDKPETATNGYTKDIEPPKTVADVNKDKTFTKFRDSTPNMHHNAESYAVLGSLCANAGLRRRDYHLFRRALLEADERELNYLIRRQSCKLPPDYFKKKAAAAAAAKKGNTPGTQKGALGAGKTPLSKTGTKASTKLPANGGKGKTSALKTGGASKKTSLNGKALTKAGAKGTQSKLRSKTSTAKAGGAGKALTKAGAKATQSKLRSKTSTAKAGGARKASTKAGAKATQSKLRSKTSTAKAGGAGKALTKGGAKAAQSKLNSKASTSGARKGSTKTSGQRSKAASPQPKSKTSAVKSGGTSKVSTTSRKTPKSAPQPAKSVPKQSANTQPKAAKAVLPPTPAANVKPAPKRGK